jgi:hypothetical protein
MKPEDGVAVSMIFREVTDAGTAALIGDLTRATTDGRLPRG